MAFVKAMRWGELLNNAHNFKFSKIIDSLHNIISFRHSFLQLLFNIKSFLYAIIFIVSNYYVSSQGFDWQYSSRLPFDIPRLFAGAGSQLSYYSHSADLKLFSDIAPECCNFNYGNGIGYTFYLQGEYWETGNIGIFAKILYSSLQSNFLKRQALPYHDSMTNTDNIYSYETDLTSKISYIFINGGTKYRIFDTHFFLGFNINIGYNLTNSISAIERILDTDINWFPDEPNPHQRQYPNSRISDLNPIILLPEILVGYDLNLGKNFYATISSQIGYNIISITNNDSWHYISVGLGITIMHAVD